MILSKGELGRTYLISAGEEKHNMEVIKAILKRLGRDERLIEHVTDRPGHDVRYALDPGRIMSELGWRPKVGFEEGIRLTTEHYKNNKSRYVG
jgi:dTDP-glucose 4,6-dehydratase